MLQSISWQEFLIAIFSIGLVYYAVVAILFFRKEFMSLLKGHGRPFRQAEISNDEVQSDDDFMGKVDDGIINDGDEPFDFLITPDEPDELHTRADEVTGPLADLLEEIKALQSVIKENQASRSDIKSFYQSLLQRYPQFVGTQYQYPISESIANSCNESLHLVFSVSEVQSWWSQVENSNA